MIHMPIPTPALRLDPSTSTTHVAEVSTCVNSTMKPTISYLLLRLQGQNCRHAHLIL